MGLLSEGGKIARAYGRGMLLQLAPMGCVFGWLALVCSGTLCAGAIDAALMGVVFWLGFFSMFPVVGVGALVFGLTLRHRRMAPLDEAFTFLGPGRGWMLAGRQWSGSVGGREVSVKIGHGTMLYSISGKPRIDVRGGRDNALARLAGASWERRMLAGGVVLFSQDAGALARIADDPRGAAAAERLLADDGRSLRALYSEADKGVTLTLRHVLSEPIARHAQDWAQDLAVLAELAEAGPVADDA